MCIGFPSTIHFARPYAGAGNGDGEVPSQVLENAVNDVCGGVSRVETVGCLVFSGLFIIYFSQHVGSPRSTKRISQTCQHQLGFSLLSTFSNQIKVSVVS